jgi:hypothetical protein
MAQLYGVFRFIEQGPQSETAPNPPAFARKSGSVSGSKILTAVEKLDCSAEPKQRARSQRRGLPRIDYGGVCDRPALRASKPRAAPIGTGSETDRAKPSTRSGVDRLAAPLPDRDRNRRYQA